MNLQVKLHTNDDKHVKDVMDRIVKENISTKLDNYLKKFDKKSDAEWIIELTIDKNKKDRFDWSLNINIDGKIYRYSREDYMKLDDLINHLFDKFKEELSK